MNDMFSLEKVIIEPIDSNLILIILLSIVTIILVIFLFTKVKFANKKFNLNEIDLSNPKEAAYKLSEYADLYAKDSIYYNDLKKELSKYKYKKNVPNFSKKTLEIINKLINY